MLLLLASLAWGVPLELNHQGRIFDGTGLPLQGPENVSFRLFAAATGGSALWEESRSVDFDGGYFAVQLGTGTSLPSTIFDGSALWVEVEVDGTAGPRQKVVSVPYAVRAGSAASVEGGVVDASEIRVGGNVVIDGSGVWQGSGGDGDTLASLTCSADQVAVFDGAGWGCGNQTSTVSWDAITGMPAAFADDDDADTLAGISCTNRADLLVWDDNFGAWGCADGALDFAIDLAAGSTLDGEALATVSASDAAYVGDDSGEIDSVADFGFASSTSVPNLDADSVDGAHKADLDAQYIDDDAGEIDSVADFAFAASTFVANLDADSVDGANKADLDAQYVDDDAGEIDAAADFAFATSTFVANLDADSVDGANKADLDAQYIDNDAGEIDAAADFAFAASTFVANLDADSVDGFAKTDLDGLYVDVAGDTMTGDLEIEGLLPAFLLNDDSDASVEWAITTVGDDLEILEPEEGDKVHLRIVDGGDIEVRPDGNPTLVAHANGDVDVARDVRAANLGLYCGKTATTYTGSGVGGYAGARTKCEAVAGCGTGAHMCTVHEYIMSRTNGLSISTGGGWISGMYNSGGSNAGDDDCDAWGGNGEYGGIWGHTANSQDLNWTACSGSWAIACCR